MERRTFLGGLTAASFGAMLENAFAEPARARSGSASAGQDSFQASQVEVLGNQYLRAAMGMDHLFCLCMASRALA